MDDPSGYWPKWIGAAFEVIAGAAMVVAGAVAIASGAGVIVGIALIAYGLNHVVSGGADLYNIAKGNDDQIGKNNFIRNKMKEGYGDDVGNVVYEVCDLAVGLTSFKVPSPTKLAKISPVMIENIKFNIAANTIQTYKGINGLQNIFSKGYNVRWEQVAITGNTVKGYIDKFIKIFNGREQ